MTMHIRSLSYYFNFKENTFKNLFNFVHDYTVTPHFLNDKLWTDFLFYIWVYMVCQSGPMEGLTMEIIV